MADPIKNSAPKMVSQNNTMTDDSKTFSGNALAGATDADNDTITVARVDSSYVAGGIGGGKGSNSFVGQYGVLTIAQDGTYIYTLNAGLNMKDGATLIEDFVLKIRDSQGAYSTGVLKFNISGTTNDRPVAVDDFYMVGSNGSTVGNVLSNDSDPDGDALHVGGVIDLATNTNYHITGLGNVTIKGVYGTLTISDTGAFTYAVDYTDPDTIALNGGTAIDKFAYKPHDGQNGEGNNTDYALLQFTI